MCCNWCTEFPANQSRINADLKTVFEMRTYILRTLARRVARPYIYNELPGWGRLINSVVVKGERLWRGQRETIVDKRTGYKLDLDLSWWADRMTFFLGRWYDLATQLTVDRHVKPGDVVIDVGANRGMFALYAAKRAGPGGRVICFEPNPACIALLEQTIRTNQIANIEIRNAGLADEAGILDLIVPAIDSGMATFANYGPEVIKIAIPCPVLVGDDALRYITPNFIKVDVEGFEPKVIRGLASTIRRHRPLIYTEMVQSHLERAGSSARELIDILSDLGYIGYRVSHRSRRQTECSYEELGDPIVDCDVLWTPKLSLLAGRD
jgi:FkbM family methyltransferase